MITAQLLHQKRRLSLLFPPKAVACNLVCVCVCIRGGGEGERENEECSAATPVLVF